MKQEFVPYELAVKLKQLGFDEPCLFAFDNCSHPMRCSDLRTNEQKFYGVNYNSSSYTSQPTFSQAFRWFRKPQNASLNHLDFMYEYLKDDSISYEEAELACLQRLIDILETKQPKGAFMKYNDGTLIPLMEGKYVLRGGEIIYII
jgi:hypothetical protein